MTDSSRLAALPSNPVSGIARASTWLAPLALSFVLGCASAPAAVVSAPRLASGDSLAPGLTIGAFRLTEVGTIDGYPLDTIFRFANGSSAFVSAIRYPIPRDVRFGSESAKWTQREGAKFAAIQDVFVSQKRISAFKVVFDSAQVVSVDGDSIFEHSVAIEVRTTNGTRMDLQYVYAVCNRFLKVRGTFPADTWPRGAFADFSREVLRLTRAAEVRSNGSCGAAAT